jgi:antitoxin component of MazEF toxin-antitoxin module
VQPKILLVPIRFGRTLSDEEFLRLENDGLDRDTPRVYIGNMTKKLIRHGNSAALVLDKALLDLLKIQMDTPLQVTTDGRNVIISPQSVVRAEATLLEALEKINDKHGSVLEKLAK